MVTLLRVKSILAAACLTLAFASPVRADDPPSAQELLKSVRIAQSSQDWKLTGRIRTGSKKIPFKLTLEKGSIRYEFTDNGDLLTLRLGEKSSTLEETKGGKTGRVTAAKLDAPVHGTEITYEDLALRFIYWRDANVIGSDMISAHRCWKVEARPAAANDSQYARVVLWIGREDGALMKAESYDAAGRWVRRFMVTEVMKRQGYWMLKKMRIESANGRSVDPKPSYLEIEEVEK
ncbi:MAG: outer membrane lipoprotein-sorting protein [Chthoniobacteraceae bacterium]